MNRYWLNPAMEEGRPRRPSVLLDAEDDESARAKALEAMSEIGSYEADLHARSGEGPLLATLRRDRPTGDWVVPVSGTIRVDLAYKVYATGTDLEAKEEAEREVRRIVERTVVSRLSEERGVVDLDWEVEAEGALSAGAPQSFSADFDDEGSAEVHVRQPA